MLVLVVILVAALLVILGFALKLFRIERVPRNQPAGGGEQAEPQPEDGADGEEPGELVDLVEYFSDDDGNGGDKRESAREQQIAGEEKTYDKLSDLIAGRAYIADCTRMLESAKEDEENCAVACFDIDRFRFINSGKGYSLGDYVLSHMAQDVRPIFPEGSLFTRLSADHFAVLFRIPGAASYEEYAEEIRKVCEKIRSDIAVKGAIRVCMGIADTTAGGGNAYNMNILLHKANLARHCLKISKTETFSLYDDSVITSYLYGESALDDYSENQYGDDISIYYQAITDTARNQVTGCEALARWSCQDGGGEAVTPDNGKIPTNNTKVFYQVCRAVSRWRKAGKHIPPVYINIPDTEFFKSDLDEFFVRCVTEFQLDPANLYAIVEADVVRIDWTVANRQIKRLRDTGMKVGIGGIDTSVKDLEFIAGLPISFIKLHKSFFQDITKRPEQETAVRAILTQAEAQNLKVIFEGVDVKEQADMAKKLGVAQTEGRYSGKAVAADDFIRVLSEQSRPSKTGDTTVILTEQELSRGEFKV